jgi:hypothetical protein
VLLRLIITPALIQNIKKIKDSRFKAQGSS